LIEHTYNQPNTQIILRQHIQPWHPASLLLHEAATAVLRMAPGSFWKFSELLFEHQEEFYDTNVLHETRLQTYSRLAQLAGEIEGIDMKKFSDLLKITSPAGNAVTKDIKLMVRANRVVGVHGTPTVFFNGLEDQSISSRWTAQQWEDWCETNLKEAAVIVS
jgi:protein-disulfide isomerase